MTSKNAKTVILDTNYWVGLFLENDQFHYFAKHRTGFYLKRNYRIIIPIVVILELISVLSNKGAAPSRIRGIVQYLFKTDKHEVHSIGWEEMLELALKHSTMIKLRSLDYQIFLYYVKFGVEKFETMDNRFDEALRNYQYRYEKKHTSED